jgi:hypothetical protein
MFFFTQRTEMRQIKSYIPIQASAVGQSFMQRPGFLSEEGRG